MKKHPMLNPEDSKVVRSLLFKLGGGFIALVLVMIFVARHIAGY